MNSKQLPLIVLIIAIFSAVISTTRYAFENSEIFAYYFSGASAQSVALARQASAEVLRTYRAIPSSTENTQVRSDVKSARTNIIRFTRTKNGEWLIKADEFLNKAQAVLEDENSSLSDLSVVCNSQLGEVDLSECIASAQDHIDEASNSLATESVNQGQAQQGAVNSTGSTSSGPVQADPKCTNGNPECARAFVNDSKLIASSNPKLCPTGSSCASVRSLMDRRVAYRQLGAICVDNQEGLCDAERTALSNCTSGAISGGATANPTGRNAPAPKCVRESEDLDKCNKEYKKKSGYSLKSRLGRINIPTYKHEYTKNEQDWITNLQKNSSCTENYLPMTVFEATQGLDKNYKDPAETVGITGGFAQIRQTPEYAACRDRYAANGIDISMIPDGTINGTKRRDANSGDPCTAEVAEIYAAKVAEARKSASPRPTITCSVVGARRVIDYPSFRDLKSASKDQRPSSYSNIVNEFPVFYQKHFGVSKLSPQVCKPIFDELIRANYAEGLEKQLAEYLEGTAPAVGSGGTATGVGSGGGSDGAPMSDGVKVIFTQVERNIARSCYEENGGGLCVFAPNDCLVYLNGVPNTNGKLYQCQTKGLKDSTGKEICPAGGVQACSSDRIENQICTQQVTQCCRQNVIVNSKSCDQHFIGFGTCMQQYQQSKQGQKCGQVGVRGNPNGGLSTSPATASQCTAICGAQN